jgi:hypothetical protein
MKALPRNPGMTTSSGFQTGAAARRGPQTICTASTDRASHGQGSRGGPVTKCGGKPVVEFGILVGRFGLSSIFGKNGG